MEEFAPQSAPQPAQIDTVCFSRYTCEEAHCLHVLQQNDGGNDG